MLTDEEYELMLKLGKEIDTNGQISRKELSRCPKEYFSLSSKGFLIFSEKERPNLPTYLERFTVTEQWTQYRINREATERSEKQFQASEEANERRHKQIIKWTRLAFVAAVVAVIVTVIGWFK